MWNIVTIGISIHSSYLFARSGKWLFAIIWLAFNSGAPTARRAAKRNPILIWERKGNPRMDFLIVFMASGIARGRVRTTTRTRTTTAAELPNMVAILQLIGWQRNEPSVCSERMPFFLAGFLKKRKLISICYVDKRALLFSLLFS